MTTTFSLSNRSNITLSSDKTSRQNFPVKIQSLTLSLQQIQKSLNRLQQEQISIKQAKMNVQQYLDQKLEENRQRLIGQLKKYEDEVKKKVQTTRNQTEKIDEKITIIKNGQIQALQLIFGIQRRVQELEIQLGLEVTQQFVE